ncbi:MAG: Dephospho-CoA kinase [Firmicutes bacterium ADurb.Bin193]|nr:MAG: Dephospho-CoA kinase [Firmicutes bacterium ADurb.Bin193]
MIIGLTGGSGSGKTTLCRAALDLGYYVINADKVGHGILLKGGAAYNEIAESFGSEILAPDGEIDRKKLGSVVFSDGEKLLLLNRITHPKITAEIKNMIKDRKGVVVIEAAALFESGFNKLCDIVIAVLAPEAERIRRISERDGLSIEDAAKRIKSQKSDEFYIENADIIIENDGDTYSLYKKGLVVFEEATNGKV